MDAVQMERLKKAAELGRRLADKKEDVHTLEEDATVFLAGLPLAVQRIFAEELYIASMIEICNERTELVVLAAICAKAANLTGECLEKLQTWLPGGVVPQDALLILTVSKILAERQKPAVVAA